MTVPSARLVTWENGTDLVIELPLDRTPAEVWETLVDGGQAGAWFAPFAVDGDVVTFDLGQGPEGDAGSGAEGDAGSGSTDLVGEILSCEAEEHVLVEFPEFGVLGIQLLPVAVTDDEPEGTVLVFTQSAADEESARRAAADVGPMWDTHLRMFARSLGVDAPDANEDDLAAAYADLDLETDEVDEADLTDSAVAGDRLGEEDTDGNDPGEGPR